LILKRTNPLDVPSIAWRALSPTARVSGHRQIEPFSAEKHLRISSLDERELPVQVDGDFIGSATEYTFSVEPGALAILA
jgi:diacylglycerol kinase family enzyme